MLGIVCLSQVLGMATWFNASALAEVWGSAWDLTPAAQGALTSAVQLGFCVGTAVAVLLNLADLVPARVYVSVSCALAAAANLALLTVDGLAGALVLRFLVGVFLAGVYPPAMKMAATWFLHGRGLAIGTVVGALILGKAGPWFARWVGFDDPVSILGSTSAGAALAAVVVALFYRDGPHAFARPRFSWALAASLVRHPPTRLAIGGYLGHMWELYAMWTWFGAFVLASLARSGHDPAWVDPVTWSTIAAGAVGSVIGGRVADVWGRDRWVILCLTISGACCLIAGFAFGAPPGVLLALGVVWGFFVVADSAQFSAMVTEVAPRDAVGTALTLQTSLGFLLTMVTIQWVPEIAGRLGWSLAFVVLVLGPAAGIACTRAWTRRVRPSAG